MLTSTRSCRGRGASSALFRAAGAALLQMGALLLVAGEARADVPPGFFKSEVACCFNQPLAFEFLPGLNGGPTRILIAERCGRLVVKDGDELPTMLEIADTNCDEEWGLLGLTIDPAFATNGYVYVYYTTASFKARVSRFTATGNWIDPATEVILWENPQLASATSHHGGNIAFGPDGMLYIATGEEMQPQWAQDLSSQRGKILRLNPDGSTPPDNPFAGVPGADPRIWALGFRNPFRFTFDSATGQMFVGDVGFSTWEEIDHVVAGFNGGWPNMEGPQCYITDCSSYGAPIWWYAHGDQAYSEHGDASITCGSVYRGSVFPAEYQGNLFVGDYVNGWIRRLVLTPEGTVAREQVFETADNAGTVVCIKVGPDGALYYSAIFGGSNIQAGVYKIEYTGSTNIAPVAVAKLAEVGVPAGPPRTVQFRGSLSYDPDRGPQPLSHHWTFGDGAEADIANPFHTYLNRGEFYPRLSVSDGEYTTLSAPLFIRVGSPPIGTITQPTGLDLYRAGDVITFAGEAMSPDLGELGPGALTWNVVIAHDTHTHPYYGPLTGVASGSFNIPQTGHPPEEMHFRIELYITDPDGLTGYAEREIFPEESFLHIDSQPSGVPVFLDENALDTPRDYQSVVNFHHVARAQDTYTLGGVKYLFSGWVSDVGTSAGDELTFTSPVGGAQMTAVYAAACLADFDGSGFVDLDDYTSFIAAFEAGDASADIDGSGFVDLDDFIAFAEAFAAGC